MKRQSKTIECLGGPLDGSRVPDSDERWFCVRSISRPREEHFYKRVKIIDFTADKSVMVWHYHGPDPECRGVPLLRPHRRKFK